MGREVVRYAVVLVAGIFAGTKVVGAVHAWQQYHIWSERDPSGADAYLTFAGVNAAVAGLSVALAALVWWLLRPAAVSAE